MISINRSAIRFASAVEIRLGMMTKPHSSSSPFNCSMSIQASLGGSRITGQVDIGLTAAMLPYVSASKRKRGIYAGASRNVRQLRYALSADEKRSAVQESPHRLQSCPSANPENPGSDSDCPRQTIAQDMGYTHLRKLGSIIRYVLPSITRQGEAPTPAHRRTEKQQCGRAKEFRVAAPGVESDAPPNWDTPQGHQRITTKIYFLRTRPFSPLYGRTAINSLQPGLSVGRRPQARMRSDPGTR